MTEATRPLSQRLFRMVVGAGVGLALCSLAAATGFLQWVATLPGEDIASVVLATMLVLLAIFAAVVSSSKGAYTRIADNYREGDPVDADVLSNLRLSVGIMLIAAVLLIAPTVAVRMGAGESASMLVAGAMGVLVLAQGWLNWRAMRHSDELTRAANAEGSVVSFWVTQIGLYFWAALAKLGLVGNVSLWTLMLVFMGVYLVISIGVSMRRGLFA